MCFFLFRCAPYRKQYQIDWFQKAVSANKKFHSDLLKDFDGIISARSQRFGYFQSLHRGLAPDLHSAKDGVDVARIEKSVPDLNVLEERN